MKQRQFLEKLIRDQYRDSRYRERDGKSYRIDKEKLPDLIVNHKEQSAAIQSYIHQCYVEGGSHKSTIKELKRRKNILDERYKEILSLQKSLFALAQPFCTQIIKEYSYLEQQEGFFQFILDEFKINKPEIRITEQGGFDFNLEFNYYLWAKELIKLSDSVAALKEKMETYQLYNCEGSSCKLNPYLLSESEIQPIQNASSLSYRSIRAGDEHGFAKLNQKKAGFFDNNKWRLGAIAATTLSSLTQEQLRQVMASRANRQSEVNQNSVGVPLALGIFLALSSLVIVVILLSLICSLWAGKSNDATNLDTAPGSDDRRHRHK